MRLKALAVIVIIMKSVLAVEQMPITIQVMSRSLIPNVGGIQTIVNFTSKKLIQLKS